MKMCKLQLVIAALFVLAEPFPAQNVKLANMALGMNETEVKTALDASAPFYVNQAFSPLSSYMACAYHGFTHAGREIVNSVTGGKRLN